MTEKKRISLAHSAKTGCYWFFKFKAIVSQQNSPLDTIRCSRIFVDPERKNIIYKHNSNFSPRYEPIKIYSEDDLGEFNRLKPEGENNE